MRSDQIFLILCISGMAVVAVCQGFCAIRLLKTEKKRVWLPMCAGAIIYALSMVIAAALLISELYGLFSSNYGHPLIEMTIIVGGHIIGQVAFVAGLACHFSSAGDLRGRVVELERIVAGQARDNEYLRKVATGMPVRKLMP